MRSVHWLFIVGTLLFLAGTAVVLIALSRPSDELAVVGLVGILGAVICFGVGAWRLLFRVDWKRVEAEQRLWESGPLGRRWLRLRKILTGR